MNKLQKSSVIISVLTFIASIIVYFYMPEIIPTHWNIYGQIDGWSNRGMSIFLGALPLIMSILMYIVPKIDPKRESYKKHANAYSALVFAITMVMVVIYAATAYAAFNKNIQIDRIIPGIVGALFVVIGYFMPQFKHNYFVGIRTPWTLASEKVWDKTHKVGGVAFVICGLIFMLQAIIPNPAVGITAFVSIILATIGMIVYSYIAFKQEQNGQ